MLASITPLGERGRRSSWGVTVTAFLLGATAPARRPAPAAGCSGAASGLGGAARADAAGGAGRRRSRSRSCSTRARARFPGPRRQVDERWLDRYRGWVYGARLRGPARPRRDHGRLERGHIRGARSPRSSTASARRRRARSLGCFGAVRGLTPLAAARVRSQRQLLALHRGLARWRARARWGAVAVAGRQRSWSRSPCRTRRDRASRRTGCGSSCPGAGAAACSSARPAAPPCTPATSSSRSTTASSATRAPRLMPPGASFLALTEYRPGAGLEPGRGPVRLAPRPARARPDRASARTGLAHPRPGQAGVQHFFTAAGPAVLPVRRGLGPSVRARAVSWPCSATCCARCGFSQRRADRCSAPRRGRVGRCTASGWSATVLT